MNANAVSKKELKKLVKSYLLEILSSRNDLLEIIEDIALARAMESGKTGKYVSEKEIYDILENHA